jgi:predicted  nucleic acid-binding Zn-ribbon protein
MALSKEKEQLTSQINAAIQELHMWHTELGKAREHDVILEATVVRAKENVRVAEANAEARIKEAVQREAAATSWLGVDRSDMEHHALKSILMCKSHFNY